MTVSSNRDPFDRFETERYWSPSPSYHRPALRPHNGAGTAALGFALVGLALFWLWGLGAIIALVGMVLGIVGLRRVNRGRATNRRVATAGLVIALCTFVVSVVWVAFLAWVLSVAGDCVNSELFPTRVDQRHCFEHKLGGP